MINGSFSEVRQSNISNITQSSACRKAFFWYCLIARSSSSRKISSLRFSFMSKRIACFALFVCSFAFERMTIVVVVVVACFATSTTNLACVFRNCGT